MVAGSRTDGGNPVTSFRVRKIIQSIKEIVGNHSDADIYAVLKESNMDPNETTQKLLNHDPFHEVRRKRDNEKELTGYRTLSDARRFVGSVQPAKSQTWDRNGRRGGYTRNSAPGVSREFRIVRDNRVNLNANSDVKPESVQHLATGKEHTKTDLTDFPEKCAPGIADQKHSSFSSSESLVVSQCVNTPCDSVPDGPGHKEEVSQSGTRGPSWIEKARGPSWIEKAAASPTITNPHAQMAFNDHSKPHSASTSTNTVIGVYSSSSDPVHVPSPSRLAGTVGAIRREVGVVGVRKQPSIYLASNLSVSSSSFSGWILGKNVSSSSGLFGQTPTSSKSSQLSQPSASEHTVPIMPTSRSSSASQYNTKIHQQPIGHQKVTQSTMEWKPKSSQRHANVSPSMSGTASATTSSHINGASNSNLVDVTNLSEKISEANILEDRHVIIPHHLRVPEFERMQLTFGSFGVGFDSTKVSSVSQTFESGKQSNAGPSISLSAAVPDGSGGAVSADDQEDLSDSQPTARSDSAALASESEQAPHGNNEILAHQIIQNYADIGLVQSHDPPYSSSHTHQLHSATNHPNFSVRSMEYYSQKSADDHPFLRTVMEDTGRDQGLASTSEAVTSHARSSSPPSTATLAHHQPFQQQQLANMYPHVHIPHFPNCMPYRHIFSPVYVPSSMTMPNYSSSPAYPHPSNGGTYFLMPGGSSHVTAGGMKYAASHYKPFPTGNLTAYGNYANPSGFTIKPPGSVGGATGLEDASRIKYKDTNLYVTNPQAETTDIWMQTPRELPNIQSAAASPFVPAAHATHASFNAVPAQSPHVHYPGLYHPPVSPAPITGPHHIVHQSGIGGNIGGVGVAAAAQALQIGAYQQPQLSHLNWHASF